MSKPTIKQYLTVDLIESLSNYYRGITANIPHEEIDVIIAKLKAADALYRIAKKEHELDRDMVGDGIQGKEYYDKEKAISDYEGE